MKKILSLAGVLLMSAMIFMGCTKGYTEAENKYIDMANAAIQEKYDVKIEKDDYKYSIGQSIKNDEYIAIEKDSTPDYVYVKAMKKDKAAEKQVVSYAVKIETATNKVEDTKCEISGK